MSASTSGMSGVAQGVGTSKRCSVSCAARSCGVGRAVRALLTYFTLDLVYNLVFKFGLEKYTARQRITSKLKISLGGRFVQSPQTRHHTQELPFAR